MVFSDRTKLSFTFFLVYRLIFCIIIIQFCVISLNRSILIYQFCLTLISLFNSGLLMAQWNIFDGTNFCRCYYLKLW